MSHKKIAALFAGVLGLVLFYQNCGKNFVVSELPSSGAVFLGSTNPNCLNDGSSDACLFLKNMVSQTDSSQRAQSASNIDALQTYAVSLNGMISGNQLSNASFSAYKKGAVTPLAKDANQKWNFRYSDARVELGQVMSFYWANVAVNKALQTTGVFYAANRGIKIISNDTVYGWAPSKSQIHLKGATDTSDMALDGSLVVYFLGLANLDYATNGRIHQVTKSNHVSCTAGSKDCCQTKMGCSRALASGAADYLVAMMFPDKPAVGEGFSDKVDGKSLCGLATGRNPQSVSTMTMAQAYALCGAQQQGNTFVMGSVYASIWFNVRQSVGAIPSEVDRLYMLHLAELTGDDDFVTAKAKILAIDQSQFGGKYSGLFNQEFNGRL